MHLIQHSFCGNSVVPWNGNTVPCVLAELSVQVVIHSVPLTIMRGREHFHGSHCTPWEPTGEHALCYSFWGSLSLNCCICTLRTATSKARKPDPHMVLGMCVLVDNWHYFLPIHLCYYSSVTHK